MKADKPGRTRLLCGPCARTADDQGELAHAVAL
jgi:hypothetical protein